MQPRSVLAGLGLTITIVTSAGCNRGSAVGSTMPGASTVAPGASGRETDARALLRVVAKEVGRQDAGNTHARARADAVDASLRHGRSLGCGMPQRGTGSYEARATEAGGLQRVYYFYAPKDYDASRAYPVIFRFHGYGGSGTSGGLEIEQATDGGALIVSPNGMLEADSEAPSWNPSHEALDLALFDALLSWVANTYCVDLDRIYAYGFSAGGGMAQVLSCRRGDALRAVGTIAAVHRSTSETCQGQTAGFLSYDRNDPAVPLIDGVAVRDHLLRQDRCSTASEPLDSHCVRYTGCRSGEPVVWCVTNRPRAMAHDPGGAALAKPIWQFFKSLPATQ